MQGKSHKTLNSLFLSGLADVYDAEKRIARALPKLIKSARDSDLATALSNHLEATIAHIGAVENVFETCGKSPRGKKCDAIIGLIAESDSVVSEYKNTDVIDAAVISAAQKIEHYEIAAYGCLREWASVMGNHYAESLLRTILDEEKNTDLILTELARAGSNVEGVLSAVTDEIHYDDDEAEGRNHTHDWGTETNIAALNKV
jgi:ferritin-like metal-binding protein YciE